MTTVASTREWAGVAQPGSPPERRPSSDTPTTGITTSAVPGSDWASVVKAMDRRLSELGLRQRDLAERAHVSQAIVRELQHNPKQRRRSARTLEALSLALGRHPGHLHALLDGPEPPDLTAQVPSPTDVVAGRLAAIESHLRAIEERLIDVQFRLDSGVTHGHEKTRKERSPTDGSSWHRYR